MDKEMYEKGLEIRRSVLGKEFVDAEIANATDFNRPLTKKLSPHLVWRIVAKLAK